MSDVAQQLSKGQPLKQLATDQSGQSVRLVALWQICCLLDAPVGSLKARGCQPGGRPVCCMDLFRQPGPAMSCAGCHAVLKQEVCLSVGLLSQPDSGVEAMEDGMCGMWSVAIICWVLGSVECGPVPAASASSALHVSPAHEPLHGRGILQQKQPVAGAHPGAWQGALHLIQEKPDVLGPCWRVAHCGQPRQRLPPPYQLTLSLPASHTAAVQRTSRVATNVESPVPL